MRKILIPTDFSDNAMNAIHYGVDLFKYEISEFYFMHAYQDEIYADEHTLTRESLEHTKKIVSKRSNELLQELIKDVTKYSPNPKHKYHVISSNSLLLDEADKIVDNAHEIIQTLVKMKPTAAKGTYIKSIYLSSTMSPSIAVEVKAV